MFGYYYGFDITYIVLVLPAVLFALWAQMRVSSTFRKYSAARTSRGLTGAQAAESGAARPAGGAAGRDQFF